ncbi:patatin-like phospholipase family protein [Clostridium saudiense]|uniref:patatin-like phospholipase family protein n=1 Tax=Clostridium saudiense TaxID=1414720 RepID=UPI00266F316F|nr:patatin-like phospholipase family protein [Clostridium saudiense]
MKNIALVLSGGGAKGAYQVGVWKAIVESGLENDIDTISATSIGAINALLFSTYKLEEIMEFWKGMNRGKIAPIIFKDIFYMVKRRSICSKEFLIRLIEDIVYNAPIHNNKINILVTCSNLRLLYPKREVYNLKENLEHIVDIVTSSCCIPCVYNHHRINGKGIYFDGGINSRTPIESLERNKYKYIIVVHNDNIGRLNPFKYRGKNIINVYPSSFQGGVFTGTYGFKADLINKKIVRGYKDAMSIIKKYELEKVNNEKVD